MASLSHSESRRMYSWWWDSHNTPKNSKWLQENITDMDGKVKTMIKLIEEDADSFARRAEMYYKKRPELMKLVEEFYRAYRALAERYNHATGELRHAHRTIAAAFPDQVPFELIEDDLVGPAQEFSAHAINSSGSPKEDSEGGVRQGGLKQLQEMFGGDETVARSSKSGPKKEKEGKESAQNLKEKVGNETERAGKAEREVQELKKALADVEAAKESIVIQCQQYLENLDKIEGELNSAQMESIKLDEKASQAEIEVQTLKEALVQFEVEKIAGMIRHEECLEKIACLEARASKFQEGKKELDERAFEVESVVRNLKDDVARLEVEKDKIFREYKWCLEKISELENVVSISEDEASMLKKEAERAESEVSELKRAVCSLNEERETSKLQYECCLERISMLEREIARAKEDVKHLKNEVFIRNEKLRTAEENCSLLETSNRALRDEADDLANRIVMKDLELSEKQEELEKLQCCLQDENSRRAQVVAALEALQHVHAQSQDDQKALAFELKNVLQILKETEVSKNGLEEEIQQVRDENVSLSRTALSMENMQNEIFSLREIRERLEKEVSYHINVSVSLNQEISCLKKEIEGLNRSYQALVEQVEAAGVSPKHVGPSIKSLLDENARLKEIREKNSKEKALLLKKLDDFEEALKKKVEAEGSLSSLQESCEFLDGEKAILVSEKASLLSQLQAMTENMNNLVRQNAVLENSLSMAKVELEGLREKSKGLEEICDLLKNERTYLLSERDSLVLKLENVERRLELMEKKYTGLEEKYGDLEKENEAMHYHVEKFKASLGEEKQERIGSRLLSETRMAGLESQIQILQEENRWKKKESEEELDRAVKAQFEMSILQKFIKDMEEKNCSLIIECQKHVEASKLAEKVISELESESLEQQVEAELLLDEIERLRLGIYQIFRALEPGTYCKMVEDERALVGRVLGSVENMKSVIFKHEDEKQLLLVENSVLLALLEELESKWVEIELQKIRLENESKIMAEKINIVKNEKDELVRINGELKSDVKEGQEAAAGLRAELRSLCVKQADLEKAYDALQEAYSRANQENEHALKKLSNLIEAKNQVDRDNDAIVLELLATANESVILKSFATEKTIELSSLLEDLNRRYEINGSVEKEMSELGRKLDLQEAENSVLKHTICKLEREIQEVRECNVQMKQEILNGKESLIRSEKNFSHLSETNAEQKKETESLHRVKKDLETELGALRQEMEENMVRGMNDEFELWENEASTFCFDLQVSSINEVLLKNKVEELTGVCQNLKKEHAGKTLVVEKMKGQICKMESEISRLKSQLSAYGPVVASLTDDLTLIEHNVLLRMKLKVARSQESEFFEIDTHPSGDTNLPLEDQSLLSLQNLQTRVKAVGKLMEESSKPISRRRSISNKQESAIGEINHVKTRSSLGRERNKKKGYAHESNDTPNDSPKSQEAKVKVKPSESRKATIMKDIPLDQVSDGSMRKSANVGSDDIMLELWETVEDGQTAGEPLRTSYKSKECKKSKLPSTDSDMEKELSVDKLELLSNNQEVNDVKILERLSYDADKLVSLQTTVENLRQKLETNRWTRKGKNVDFDTVKKQLQEAEGNIVQLVDLNGQLVKNIEECPHDETLSPRMRETVRVWREKVMEQAEKGSERIEMVELSVQKIQFMVMRVEEERKNGGRGKLLRSRSVILRDFIQNGKRNSGRRKKGPNCGCFRQATSGNGRGS